MSDIVCRATAGTLESSDVLVTLEPNDNGLDMGYDDNAYDNITGMDFSGTETDNSGIMGNGYNANNGNGINNGGMASSSDTGSNY